MKIKTVNLDKIKRLPKHSALVIGAFNGFHKGHLSLIDAAKSDFDHISILTFDISPKAYFLKEKDERITLINENDLGFLPVDYVLVLPSSEKLYSLTKEEFIENIIKKLNPEAIYVGSVFRFGKDALGTPEFLTKNYPNVFSLPVVLENGEKASSTTIKTSIKEGDIEKANNMLGRSFAIEGMIQKGLGNGSKIGFKTINIPVGDYVCPRYGVYRVRVKISNMFYEGVANVGIHPSIDKLEKPIIEVHIFNFKREIYGKSAKVYFLHFMREERKYSSIDALITQIKQDVEEAKNLRI